VSKSASSSTVWASERLTYTLSLSHTSAITATGVIITDRLPSGTLLVWASGGGNLSGAEVRWELGSISPTQQTQVQFAVQVQPVVSGTVITNDRYGLLSDQTMSLIGGSPVVVTAYSNSVTVFLPLLLR
jgi:uncharacterized repeat protein (TIGR01451 family)